MTLAAATDSFRESPTEGLTGRPVYLDSNATTPVDPRVRDEVMHYLAEEFGNAGSRTHTYGAVAKQRVNRAREEIARVVGARPDEVLFTSGATESNNIALLGLAPRLQEEGRRHIVSTMIEHKAVLEPLAELERRGFEVTLIPPGREGVVDATSLVNAIRPDTGVVSMMSVNNETGVIQPVAQVADLLADHPAFFHVDAAQGFGKQFQDLRSPRIDLMSVSGHKIHAPKGIGALVTRRRGYDRPPLRPLQFGGGQERALRPGTLPVALIAGFATAATLATAEAAERSARCWAIREGALAALVAIGATPNGDLDQTVPHTLNFSIAGVDSEAAIVALKDLVAVSNGSACTSQSYEASHVLLAAGLSAERISGAIRMSWSYLTPDVPWDEVAVRLRRLARG